MYTDREFDIWRNTGNIVLTEPKYRREADISETVIIPGNTFVIPISSTQVPIATEMPAAGIEPIFAPIPLQRGAIQIYGDIRGVGLAILERYSIYRPHYRCCHQQRYSC